MAIATPSRPSSHSNDESPPLDYWVHSYSLCVQDILKSQPKQSCTHTRYHTIPDNIDYRVGLSYQCCKGIVCVCATTIVLDYRTSAARGSNKLILHAREAIPQHGQFDETGRTSRPPPGTRGARPVPRRPLAKRAIHIGLRQRQIAHLEVQAEVNKRVST
jgi:hypothetical protein